MHIPHGAYEVDILPEGHCMELLMFASCAPFKGLEQLLAAFHDLQRHYPALRLTIAGGEHPRFPGYLDHMRQRYGEHPAISWLGFVPEHELREVFARAMLVVLPYTATTGSSGVLYRAAAWGRPIIASDLPELRATAEEEGLLVQFCPSGDAAALLASVLHLLSDPLLRAAQVNHNHHIIANHLTLTNTCQSYLRAFDLALSNHNNRSKFFSTADISA
jgi:glycosyltransferase involved in cell wall biosynthesis